MKKLIKCEICKKKLKVISNSHLKKHGVTCKEYKEKYKTLTSELTLNKFHNRILSEEHKKNISIGTKKAYAENPEYGLKISNKLKGNIPWNKNKKMSLEFCKKVSINNSRHFLGKKHSIKTKNKISKSLTGLKQTQETINKRRKNQLGYKHTEEAKKQIGKKVSKKLTGRKLSIEHRKKISYSNRISRIKQIERCKLNGEPLTPQIGKYETEILDNLEKCFYPYKIQRQYPIRGFFLDGYCSALNLAIEIDEPHHLKEENIKRDIKRQQEIEEYLKCKFLRIPVTI